MVKYSIIIPVYNNLHFTYECVRSVFDFTNNFELIVVDNGSSDGTPYWLEGLQRNFPYVRFIRFPENRGFATAVNAGLQACQGQYIVLLNNDTIVTPGWADSLAEAFDKAPKVVHVPKIGIVGPVSNNVAGLQRVKVDPPTTDPIKVAEAIKRKKKGQYTLVAFLSGFCMMFTREVLETVGLLDERFNPGGYEDNDYVIRAWMKGYPAVIAQEVFVWHEGSATIKHFPQLRGGLANWYKFFEKWNRPRKQRLIAVYRVKNAARWLKRSLDSAAQFADGAVVLDTGSSDDTLKIARSHPLVLASEVWHDEFNEREERNAAIQLALEFDPDWIISIDGDEVFEKSATRERFEKLMNVPDPRVMAYGFHWYTFWDPYNWRADGIFGRISGWRLCRVIPGFKILAGTDLGLHCGNIPSMPVDGVVMTSIRIKHYGYEDVQLRRQKYDFYSKIDPEPDEELVGRSDYGHILAEQVELRPWVEPNRIGLCMIAKNEDFQLFEFLRKHCGWDEIVVADTGSTDHTKEVVQSFGGKVVEAEWHDSFAEARNLSLDACSCEWILHLDPDEVVEPTFFTSVRRMVDSNVDAFLFYVNNVHRQGVATISEAVRLFRNIPEFRYEGRVHETVNAEHIKKRNVRVAPMRITHLGYLKPPERVQSKLDQYLRLNLMQMEDDPTDCRPYFNIALHYINEGKLDEAEQMLLKAIQLNPKMFHARKELGVLWLRKVLQLYQALLEDAPNHHPLVPQIRQIADTIRSWIGSEPLVVGRPNVS